MTSPPVTSPASPPSQHVPKPRRHGKIFLADSYPTHIYTLKHPPPKAVDKKRFGQIFPIHLDEDKRRCESLKSKFAEQVEIVWYTISEVRETRHEKRTISVKNTSIPRDGLEEVRCRLRSIKSFDDMLVHGFIVNEALHEYEATVRFSLTPKIAGDR
ncbi:hypothetical protein K493DRAFT_357186 [Basidiobolus meristosporus CBS 931.73]|uniref:Uncharacterized protein n=1 Tax=Basidiobolus meristosporus CBS 931.73 TaxID=1314790 RepID=A0A1Y1XWN8_9FUNG|nr:hypothetical protein K493DRAFT_357186 [Basidiobolus meristosporus CBS 931.73]|eukprot:ORX90171.1 hypothetical protein K493DRAFT_357186 [Basidiobolus meristosporus CBS 931.73]